MQSSFSSRSRVIMSVLPISRTGVISMDFFAISLSKLCFDEGKHKMRFSLRDIHYKVIKKKGEQKMQYLITFLEGIISFISPCMLPMLPIYISYFAGGEENKKNTFLNALSFVLGFTVVYTALGLFAGSLGTFLSRYQTAVNIVSGALVIIFGLSYLEIIRIPFFKGMNSKIKINGVISAFVFGVIYSISLTPCVGAFLGSALMLASSAGGALKGTLLLLVYSLGLGIPFVFSAVLIDKLKGAISFIKKHYKVINIVCGVFLVVVGIFMMTGFMNVILSIFG